MWAKATPSAAQVVLPTEVALISHQSMESAEAAEVAQHQMEAALLKVAEAEAAAMMSVDRIMVSVAALSMVEAEAEPEATQLTPLVVTRFMAAVVVPVGCPSMPSRGRNLAVAAEGQLTVIRAELAALVA